MQNIHMFLFLLHYAFKCILSLCELIGSYFYETSNFESKREAEVSENMAEHKTLKEVANPNVNQQPLCIEFPNIDVAFELKSGLIHLLPTFQGLAGEDPYKYLKEFHIFCSTMKPQGVIEEHIKLRAFPFSLANKAKDWLYYLPSGSIRTWIDLKRKFLEKFFPPSRAGTIQKEISGILQNNAETLYEY